MVAKEVRVDLVPGWTRVHPTSSIYYVLVQDPYKPSFTGDHADLPKQPIMQL